MATRKERRAQRVRELKQKLLEAIEDSTSKVFISEKNMRYPNGVDAETHLDADEIIIHPKNSLSESVHSFIHENLHMLMPDTTERSVTYMAKAIYVDMSVQERQKVFRVMARKASWED